MTGDRCVFKFLRRNVDGKHLMHFQSETSVFKFLRRSVDGALVFVNTSIYAHSQKMQEKHLLRLGLKCRSQQYVGAAIQRNLQVKMNLLNNLGLQLIKRRFHSRGQQPWKFIETRQCLHKKRV